MSYVQYENQFIVYLNLCRQNKISYLQFTAFRIKRKVFDYLKQMEIYVGCLSSVFFCITHIYMYSCMTLIDISLSQDVNLENELVYYFNLH